ncbi:hypothetical protein ACFV3R_11365 [Streptomyces sp. NPDC059740]|uniref:hypothetical protein n=1 Tax=Streptomyces sp. NPDC059740 TaxID=3346926 RepID=UPI00365B4154
MQYLGRRTGRGSLLLAGALALVVLLTALSGATVRAWAYTDPAGRYARAYGGDGQCLADTAYRSDQVHISLYENAEAKPPQYDHMHVTPDDRTAGPTLNLQQASEGGDLQGADTQTTAFLAHHHCPWQPRSSLHLEPATSQVRAPRTYR